VRRALLWLAAGATLLAWLPLFSVLTASLLANAYGCRLHEGFPNPCVIAGADRGETLYAMGVMGWFMLVTGPFMLLSLVGWPIYAAVRWWQRRA
jgi:hypothetical protein